MIDEQVMKHTPELYPPRDMILRALERMKGSPILKPETARRRRSCPLCGHSIGRCAMPVAQANKPMTPMTPMTSSSSERAEIRHKLRETESRKIEERTGFTRTQTVAKCEKCGRDCHVYLEEIKYGEGGYDFDPSRIEEYASCYHCEDLMFHVVIHRRGVNIRKTNLK